MMADLMALLLTWSMQSLVVVSIAAAAERLLRTSRPAVRLAYWRGIALLCLALPLLPDIRSASSAFETFRDLHAGASAALADAAPGTGAGTAARVIPWAMAAGISGRLLWLYAGALRLARMRRRSMQAVLDEETQPLHAAVAPHADIRRSDEVSQPVTFGMRPPVILLPRGFDALSGEGRRAVVCHELLHVARRDWLSIVIEEHLRAVFWYHPAVWWLLSRLDLSREQVVDQAVVERTGARRTYMSALLAFADRAGTLSPSLAFLRRRHLYARLRQLSKEPVMSTRHLVWTIAALVAIVGGAATAVANAMPLDLTPAAQDRSGTVAGAQDEGVTPPSPTHVEKPRYTAAAMQAGIEGSVHLEAVVGSDGTVNDVRIIRSLDKEHGLDEEAVAAAKRWRFSPGRKNGEAVAVLVVLQMEFVRRQQK
jgi:TonB family protein